MNKFFLVSVFLLVPIVIAEEVSDPFEDLNRVSFEFNEKLDGKIQTNISKIKNYCKTEEYHQEYIEKNR